MTGYFSQTTSPRDFSEGTGQKNTSVWLKLSEKCAPRLLNIFLMQVIKGWTEAMQMMKVRLSALNIEE